MSAEHWKRTYVVSSGLGFTKDDLLGGLRIIGYQGQPTPRSGVQCFFCNNMKPKDLRKYDSCPECGKSLFARKQEKRKW